MKILLVFYFFKAIREYKDTYHLNFMFLKAIIYLTVEIIRKSKDTYHLSLIFLNFLKAVKNIYFFYIYRRYYT